MDWETYLRDIEDQLFPKLKLDIWEKSLYYHLLRHTHLSGIDKRLVGIQALAKSSGMSDWKVREVIRSMNSKGCIQIEDRSGKGHLIRVLLPFEIVGLIPDEQCVEQEIDVASLDFFTGRKYVEALIERENGRCFYCLRELSSRNCVLDHVKPQVAGVDNSYRNIVASCHECNSMKQGKNGEDFIRLLYRKGLLAMPEFEERLTALELLCAGNLIPRIR